MKQRSSAESPKPRPRGPGGEGRIQIVLASGNANKAQEFRELAAGSGAPVSIATAMEFGGMPPVAEDTGSFIGNARKKARALREKLGGHPAWVLADDSGICVDALGGAPGVESAYYAGLGGDALANRRKLMQQVGELPESRRGAHFYCVLLVLTAEGAEHSFEGRCEGRLVGVERGSGGFGYDPIFIPEGFDRTLAELGGEAKNRISHRGRAWERFAAWLRSQSAL